MPTFIGCDESSDNGTSGIEKQSENSATLRPTAHAVNQEPPPFCMLVQRTHAFGTTLAQVIANGDAIMHFRATVYRIGDGFLVMIAMSKPASVLIVEDDEDIAALIADALREETDARPFILHNGSDAIRFLAEQPVDLLILDYQLPGANGLEVYDAIRQNARTRHTPVLFITANDTRAEFQRRGLTSMRKPFNVFELLATVEERLSQSQNSAAITE